MKSALSKQILACMVALFALLTNRSAAAQTGGTTGSTGSSTLALSDFTLEFRQYDKVKKTWIAMNETEKKFFFSSAHCECNGDLTDYSGYFKILIRPTTNALTRISQALFANGTSGSGRLYAGGSAINCLQQGTLVPGSLKLSCVNLLDPNNYDAEFSMSDFYSRRLFESNPIPVAWLFGSTLAPVCNSSSSAKTCDNTDTCKRDLIGQRIYFWAQTKSDGLPDSQDISWEVKLNGQINAAPIIKTPQPGNEALTVSWEWPSGQTPSTIANFKGVQVFCQRGANDQVFPNDTFGRAYDTTALLCPSIASTAASEVAPFSNFSPMYLCSGLLSSTSNSYRITGLQNGIPYGVAVVAVDSFRNIGPTPEIVYGTPIPTVDFYSEYKREGGEAQGGFCEVAGWGEPNSALVVLGLAGLALLVIWRRRSKPRSPGPTLLALIISAGTLAAFSSQARAQGGYRNDDSLDQDRVWKGNTREHAIELRFGLYTPNVDSEFAGKPGPNTFIFGTQRRPMWQLEYDWEFFQGFGTLAVGASIGYFKENATACKLIELVESEKLAAADKTGSTKITCTPSGDNTSLRLVPIAALLIYRLDEFAEYWGIPLVPYGKVGLNYTFWTVNDGNGNVPETSGGGRGQGGTAGWQAAVGISFQLDFLDSSAARGLNADVGVNHTYAFFELTHINGSGLYRSNVLRVGDNTWFAGLMFEF